MNPIKPPRGIKCHSVTLRRSGAVSWGVDCTSPNHCGAKEHLAFINGRAVIAVKYDITLVAKPQLDARGFLFDQLGLVEFMERQAQESTSLSCEALARHTCTRLLHELQDNSPTCSVLSLTLTLSPAPHQASLTTHWESHDGG